MATLPLLIFPRSTSSSRTAKNSFNPPKLISPSKNSQVKKFSKKIDSLLRVFQNRSLRFNRAIDSLLPEMLLVFEIAGTIDEFFKAFEKTTGLKYILETEEEEPVVNSGFYFENDKGEIVDKPIDRRLFVTLTNQSGIDEILRFWKQYKFGSEWKHGTAKFNNLFKQLLDIRLYNLSDRILDTGFEQYIAEVRNSGNSSVNFEIEFVYHPNAKDRQAIISETNELLREYQGRILKESIAVIDDIKYFGAIAEASLFAFDDLSDDANISFLQSERILFFKPVGQSVNLDVDIEGEIQTDNNTSNADNLNNTPIVALLDGFPLEQHLKLNNKLIIDDPDNKSGSYQPSYRNHGTTMSSLIVNGDLFAPTPITSKLYVRPILELQPAGMGNYEERLPTTRLTLDIIHRAVRRMFEGEGNIAAVAPTVKVINFSIGDPFRPFLRFMSTWAKLLDYLSFKYNVIFVVSAGNYLDNVEIDCSFLEFEQMSDSGKESIFYKALFRKNVDRKILTPSESINALTIGGLHTDTSTLIARAGHYNVCTLGNLPSPISRIGFGFNRSIKPEIIYDCGRIMYRVHTTDHKTFTLKTYSNARMAPGVKVAIPGGPGQLNNVGYSIGTSNAAALITNKACLLNDVLNQISNNDVAEGGEAINAEFYPVLIKALIVHYADTSKTKQKFENILTDIRGVTPKIIKPYINQNIGYGVFNNKIAGFCTDYRVSLIGYGKLKADQGHLYRFPLPNILSGKKVAKKLSITLAWISPCNFKSGKYRMAQLYFDNIQPKTYQTELLLDRAGAGVYESQRGTVQHDILTNDAADAYVDKSDLVIKVNCMESASGLSSRQNKYEVRYGLIVSFEINEDSKMPIYQEVKARVGVRLPAR